MNATPVALFAYSRPDRLRDTLECLKADGVPLIYAFSDGPRTPAEREPVERVRELLRAVRWADVRLVERAENLGLGRSILTGVEAVLAEHQELIVFEDDLVCCRGTYAYFQAALERYREEPKVLSVTAYTHPRITPRDVSSPYFDGRAESLTWAAWRRSWRGMERDAVSHLAAAAARGVDPGRYGWDLPGHAAAELRRNIWAVRWVYHHIAQGGLCLRPPRSLVDHTGWDPRATNAAGDRRWSHATLGPPPEDGSWPLPVEHPACAALWRRVYPKPSWPRRKLSAALAPVRRWLRSRA